MQDNIPCLIISALLSSPFLYLAIRSKDSGTTKALWFLCGVALNASILAYGISIGVAGAASLGWLVAYVPAKWLLSPSGKKNS